ncbi:unnamed protein product, partial [marine sediment metagenome]
CVVIGDVAAGAKRTFNGLSLSVEVGDYIGMYYASGEVWVDALGAGYFFWYKSGEYIDPDDEATYTPQEDRDFSLYGQSRILLPPILTTEAVSDIRLITATGHGTIIDVGLENCSKRGVCWNTTGNPTVADGKSEEEGSFGVGAFTRPMTDLTPNEHHYVKAYAYNSDGYGYGGVVEFDTEFNVKIDTILKYAGIADSPHCITRTSDGNQ